MPARSSAKAAAAKEGSRPAARAIRWRTAGLKPWLSRRRAVRRGEKVPPAGGTVADRLAQGEGLTRAESQGSVLVADGAEVPAVGAGQFGGEGPGAPLQGGGGGALGKAGGGPRGQVFQRLEIEARLVADPAGDNFPPAGSQFTDLLDLLGG